MVLFRFGRDESEVLCRDDLISVNVVANDVADAMEAGCGGGRSSSRGGSWGKKWWRVRLEWWLFGGNGERLDGEFRRMSGG